MKLKLAAITFVLIALPAAARAQEVKRLALPLGETKVSVNVYSKPGDAVTYFAPHHDEQTALKLAKEAVAQHGGRLVEVESFDESGVPARRLRFQVKGQTYTVDPNRIFTASGRRCAGLAPEAEAAVAKFAEELLRLILPPDEEGAGVAGRVLVAVHNNADSGEKAPAARASDLTATAYVRSHDSARASRAGFDAQAAGVYLSNAEDDPDNFVLLSTPKLVGYFAAKDFNVVVQKPAGQLSAGQCGEDDGSLSVYAGQHGVEYVCLEADAAHGAARQRQMFEAVHGLVGANDAGLAVRRKG
ncbi:MAG TPA: hypothetical protein VFA21_18470 [Pyrinomonadaceae bacterium]|nr:hypothetical protein [Pyrinomonadaceae bacterium]